MCDSSTSRNNGTYAAGVQLGRSGAVAGDSAAGAGSASSGIGTGGPNSGLTGRHDFTLETWFRSTTPPHNQSLVNMGEAGEGNIAGLSTWTSTTGDGKPSQLVLDLYVGVSNASALPIWDTSTVGVNLWDGRWHYLAITYSAATDKVDGYVDGQDMGALTPLVAINLEASRIRVGYWVDSYLNPDVIGDEDEVAVYPAALSPARIEAHFVASGRSLSGSIVSTTVPTTGSKLALGTNNPAQGDCATNTPEAAVAVGSVVLTVTSSSFSADINLLRGSPKTTYEVFLQQTPGGCPLNGANGGTLTTDSTGRGQTIATVPLVTGATTFFVQLVPPSGSGAPEFTSDRIYRPLPER